MYIYFTSYNQNGNGKVPRLLKGYKNVDELDIKVFPLVNYV